MLLLIDNYDSFTYNLVQYLGDLNCETTVVRNDELSVQECLEMNISGIIISPGPASPDKAGICIDLIRAAAQKGIPLLGVCLGHQAIGAAFGGKVIRAPAPVHGEICEIRHEGKGIFQRLAKPAVFTRYHSLIVERATLPECLDITAECPDGLIMALQHKLHPIYGVQFHPESIGSAHGKDLLRNFVQTIKTGQA